MKYSQPRPAGGAAFPIVSNAPVDLSMRTAVRSPFTRTRCCVMRDPASDARYFCSRTSITCEVTRSISFDASARSLSASRKSIFSIFGDGKRIDLVARDVRVVIDRLVGERDGLGVERRERLGDFDGAPRDRRRPRRR